MFLQTETKEPRRKYSLMISLITAFAPSQSLSASPASQVLGHLLHHSCQCSNELWVHPHAPTAWDQHQSSGSSHCISDETQAWDLASPEATGEARWSRGVNISALPNGKQEEGRCQQISSLPAPSFEWPPGVNFLYSAPGAISHGQESSWSPWEPTV